MAPLPEDLQKLKWYGDFPVMERVIQKRLRRELPAALKERLLAELEIIRRLPRQYPYSWEEAWEIMAEHFRDFSRQEFQELWEEDAMDWIYIQGKVHFRSNFLSNLIKTREELCRRLLLPELAAGKWENRAFLTNVIKEMKEKGGISRRFRLRALLEISKEAQRPGEEIRVYLPLPVEYAQVKDFRLLHAQIREGGGKVQEVPFFSGCPETWDREGKSGFTAWMAPEHAAQRTLCFIGEYQEGMSFQIEYEYRVDMPYLELGDSGGGEGTVRGWNPQDKEDMPENYLGEQLPHIHFTPYLKALAEEIVGQERQPLRKARKIYDYITSHLMYSFVRDYFSITELVDYTASGWKGDCGLQALLFITLCRIAGVPARWQSGLYVKPGDVGSHDWAMFYVEEYGWLFADCSFGGSAGRMGCEERREFYFGNLDPYRMPSCCQFQADFLPPIKGLRIDPYDNQTGEAEYADRCLYAEEIETEYEVREMEEEA